MTTRFPRSVESALRRRPQWLLRRKARRARIGNLCSCETLRSTRASSRECFMRRSGLVHCFSRCCRRTSRLTSPLRRGSPGSGAQRYARAADSGGSPCPTLDQRSLGACADLSQTAQSRSDLKPARSSSEKISGCSHAAKCPPLWSLL